MKRSLLILITFLFITLFMHNPFPVAQTEWVHINGTVTYNGTAVCGMVLANGQYMFTCGNSLGVYDLEVPLDGNGEITLYAFVSGFSPFKSVLRPEEALDFDILMTRAAAGSREIDITLQSAPGIVNPDWIRISGTVTYDGTPLCAMILANGQNMFSCGDDLGTFDMEVPLDGNGEILLYVFGSGFSPYKIVDTPEDVGSGEIREYEGQTLSSVYDFRENSILGPQYIAQETYELRVTGLVETPMAYSYADVVENFDHYSKVVTLNCVEGWSVTILWEGVLVRDLIGKANPTNEAKAILFHAYDGYTTSFPIDYIMDYEIIMAFKINDIRLPPERGFPFQLVAESKWGYKWIKWITEIELSNNENYLGYWESRGYSNDASLYNCSPGPISAQQEGHTERTDCCTCHGTN